MLTLYIYLFISLIFSCVCLHVKYTLFLPNFMKLEFPLKKIEKYSNIKLHENMFIGSRTDRQTEMTNLTVAFAILQKPRKF